MRSMCLSVLAERPHAFKQFWGGTFCEGIITPPLLTLNMRGTASMKRVVKVNKQLTLGWFVKTEIEEPNVWDVCDHFWYNPSWYHDGWLDVSYFHPVEFVRLIMSPMERRLDI